jgi:hypothetical protein
LHPEPSQPQASEQQPLAINAPGQHMPRAVAAIAKGSRPLPPAFLRESAGLAYMHSSPN